ncbi:MAG: PQQ-dependent sugar dehydrogenase [Bacteroidales bacterium]
MLKIAAFIFFLAFGFVSCNNNDAQPPEELIESEELSMSIDTLASGLENPWSMAFLPDGRILIAERPGRLRIYALGELRDEPVDGLPDIWDHGQGGLLDVVLHPDYEDNGWIYIAYSEPRNGEGNTAVARGRMTGNSFTDVEVIFRGQPSTGAGQHFGTRIVFDDGYLFTTIGDRGTMRNAQTLENHNGKVFRLFDDGRIPPDNPFVDVEGAMPEIWSYGHRNIQGMGLHPETGDLWAHEHGPKGGDEINIVQKGLNYGWPEVSYGINYDGSIITEDTTMVGIEDPVLQWTPSIAPCGLAFVDGDRYPQWQNNMLVGALAGQHIHRVVIENNEVVHTEYLLQDFARFRDIRVGPDGYIYVLTEAPGLFFRIVPW